MLMILLSLLNCSMCQEALDLERSNRGERAESKCKKDSDLWYRPGPPAEFRAATASSTTVASTGCTRNAVGSRA